jgi:hypothetical protein
MYGAGCTDEGYDTADSLTMGCTTWSWIYIYSWGLANQITPYASSGELPEQQQSTIIVILYYFEWRSCFKIGT